jgi:predicted TIM-barrel fold metal-dependent hydrolase
MEPVVHPRSVGPVRAAGGAANRLVVESFRSGGDAADDEKHGFVFQLPGLPVLRFASICYSQYHPEGSTGRGGRGGKAKREGSAFMIIDIHTHLFSKDVRENREKYFPDESAFRLLYESPKSKIVGAEETIAAMDEDAVDTSVIFGFPWKNLDTARENNDAVADAVSRYPQRLVGFACFDPVAEGAEAEAERCLDAGLSGIGELAFYESGISETALDRLSPVMDLCRERQVPVMVHTNEPVGHVYPGKTPNTLAEIYRLVKRFSENRFILAHWGAGLFFYSLLKKEVTEALRNVWVDTAASPFLYRSEIYPLAADLLGVEKILFGTDFPLLRAGRYFSEIEAAGVSDDDRKKILGENAKALLGLSASEAS